MSEAGKLSEMLADNVDAVVIALLPNARKCGGFWKIGDIDGNKGRSLYIHRNGSKAGNWTDAATEQHGDLLDLARAVLRLDLPNACAWARHFLGLPSSGFNRSAEEEAKAEERRRRREEADRREAERMLASARRMWESSTPDEIIGRYFRNRGIRLRVPASIRFNPRLWHSEKGCYLPGMVAAVQGVDGKFRGIHRTFFDPASVAAGNPLKVSFKPDKATLCDPSGCAVRLAKVMPDRELIVGEGIETTLSAMQMYRLPGWSALAAPFLETLLLPEDARAIVIAADHDANGRGERAAKVAASRWAKEGKRVRIIMPCQVGTDFNDVIVGNREVPEKIYA